MAITKRDVFETQCSLTHITANTTAEDVAIDDVCTV